MFEKFIDFGMRQFINSKEHLMRDALTKALGDEWTINDVKTRCQLVRRVGETVEVLTLDGEPILELHDPEFTPPMMEGDRYVAHVHQKYRWLGRAAKT
jgi:hypothetical protein